MAASWVTPELILQHTREQRISVLVIGGGQAGLAIGHYLRRMDYDFMVLDAGPSVGHTWRSRWDSLRLFTPARWSGLPGMPFPAPRESYPAKDEMADYLEAYATRFDLPIRLNSHVTCLRQSGPGYSVMVGDHELLADQVVVAVGAAQSPFVPALAQELDPGITQLHSTGYQNPDVLPAGEVVVVGAGNSGAEIAVELANAGRRVLLSGRDVGRIPLGGLSSDAYWWVSNHLLSLDTPIGRKVMHGGGPRHGTPLQRLSAADISRAGIERVPRVTSVEQGLARLTDGRTLDAPVVVWATGFRMDWSWIDVPVFDTDGQPLHDRGVVPTRPGMYFLGLPLQRTLNSSLIGGVGADARYIAARVRRHAS